MGLTGVLQSFPQTCHGNLSGRLVGHECTLVQFSHCQCFPSQLHPWICQNQWAPALRGFLARVRTSEGAQPSHCPTIITIAASVEGPIVPFLALWNQTGSTRTLSGTDLGVWHLVPCLAKSTTPVTVGPKEINFTQIFKSSFSCVFAERSLFARCFSWAWLPTPFWDHFFFIK